MSELIEARRKAFEAWVQYRQYLKRNDDGSYNEEWVEARWIGWQAALDSVVVELPPTIHVDDDSEDPKACECDAYNNGIAACYVAIHAAGIKTKVKV